MNKAKRIKKHAFLITAYKNEDYLLNLIDALDSNKSLFYINIDKKSPLNQSEKINELNKRKNIYIIKNNIKVNWGGFSIVEATILLVNFALKNKDVFYFHNLSDQCFPLKPINEILSFFENSNKEFIEYEKVSLFSAKDKHLRNRIRYFQFYDTFNARVKFQEKIIMLLLTLQRGLLIRRPYFKKYPHLYKGAQWWSLTLNSIKYASQYMQKNPNFYKRFKYTHCPDEMFFQTLILNSPYKSNIMNNNLRYIDWKKRNGNYPANLDETDYDKLINGNKLFARKFEYPVSERLLQKIKLNISK